MTEHMTATDPGLLTPDEHRAVAMAGELWGLLCQITTDGLARSGDLQELIAHIHAIQRTVLKQAAARAYPELYRLLGGDPPPLPRAEEWPHSETVTEHRLSRSASTADQPDHAPDHQGQDEQLDDQKPHLGGTHAADSQRVHAPTLPHTTRPDNTAEAPL